MSQYEKCAGEAHKRKSGSKAITLEESELPRLMSSEQAR